MRMFFSKSLTVVLLFFVSLGIFATPKIFNVMAPLDLPISYKDNDKAKIDSFKTQLRAARAVGTNAVSVDVWWGLVEQNKGEFKFDEYYKQMFQDIVDVGLQIIPIMSFHACGGNIGDTVNIPIPSWIWKDAGTGAKYINEQLYNGWVSIPDHKDCTPLSSKQEDIFGNSEVVSLWASNRPLIERDYQDFIKEFLLFMQKNNFDKSIQLLDISCGPSGECRYPSFDGYKVTYQGREYNVGQGCPTRGFLQCYSANAIASFQEAMRQEYTNSIDNLNAKWGTTLQSFEDSGLRPPTNGDGFFKWCVDTNPRPQYALDFINWYNQLLVAHGSEMISDAISAFEAVKDPVLDSCAIEIKIPGVAWQMSGDFGNGMPRSAEICAGLISGDFQADVYNNGCGPGPFSVVNCGRDYENLFKMVKSFDNPYAHRTKLDFTCLEQPNKNFFPDLSWAATLVYCIGQEANRTGVTLTGENALAPNNGWSWDGSPLQGIPIRRPSFGGGQWANICYAMTNAYYQAITILRISDLTTNGQTMYRNYHGLILNFNRGQPGVPDNCPPLP